MSDTPPPTAATAASALPAQVKALWAKLPARARTGAIASMVAIAALVLYLVLNAGGGTTWKSVTPGLNKADVATLIGELNRAQITSRVRNGTDVQVPASRHAEALAIANRANVPSDDDETFKPGPTDPDRVSIMKLQQALQNRLTNRLERLGPIERATVNLAPPRDSVYSRKELKATASVQVQLRPGARLTRQQVLGIKLFIASGVQGLSIENVAVIDQNAVPLSESGDDRAEVQTLEEQTLAEKVRAVIEPVVGADKLEVQVRVEYDRRTINTTDEDFGDTSVRSQETVTTPAAQNTPIASGIAGTSGNLPGTAGGTTTPGAPPSGATVKQQTNNDIDRKTTVTQDPADRIARINVVVLVADGVDDNGDPKPRTPEELAKLKAFARGAAGLVDSRGDTLTVDSMPFAPPIEVAAVVPPKLSKLPVPLPVLGGGGAAVLIAAAVLLMRRKRKPAEDVNVRIALPAPVAELERALTPASEAEAEASPALPPGRSLEERVIGAVKSDIPRASRVLAGWLGEPDPIPTPTNGKGARA